MHYSTRWKQPCIFVLVQAYRLQISHDESSYRGKGDTKRLSEDFLRQSPLPAATTAPSTSRGDMEFAAARRKYLSDSRLSELQNVPFRSSMMPNPSANLRSNSLRPGSNHSTVSGGGVGHFGSVGYGIGIPAGGRTTSSMSHHDPNRLLSTASSTSSRSSTHFSRHFTWSLHLFAYVFPQQYFFKKKKQKNSDVETELDSFKIQLPFAV